MKHEHEEERAPEERPGNRAPDHSPNIGTDPMSQPQEGPHKEQVHLDRDAVRRADEQRARDRATETDEEHAARIKNA